jgi:hypothetical protein
MPKLLINKRVAEIPEGGPSGGPWMPLATLEKETGWELKPEGACFENDCVPLPAGVEPDFVRDGWFNFGALASHMSLPVAHDDETGSWCIGESGINRQAALETLTAPDFTLPDQHGVEHQLSDYRGKKVFLVSWASW